MTGVPLGARARALLTELDRRTDEPLLAEGLTRFVAAQDLAPSMSTAALVLRSGARHPVQAVLTALALARLPRLTAHLDDSPGGTALREELTLRYRGGLARGAGGVAVLPVPATPGEYLLGPARATVRRKVRAAQKRGVTCRPVDDLQERHHLLALGEEAERQHHDARYRNRTPDNSGVLTHDLWLVAEADGEPLVLSVTPTSGAWGSLRYFRTTGSSPAHSDARYLAMARLADELAARGVTHLVDSTPPFKLPNGLRHFQRMLGFRYTRVVVGRTPPRG